MDGRKIYKRALAVLLAIPMLVLLFGCATENELGIREKESKDMLTLERWFMGVVSTSDVNWIHLNGEEGSEFTCTTSSQDKDKEGSYLVRLSLEDGAPTITVENGTTVMWSSYCHPTEDTPAHYIENETVWLEFINRKDDHIIGYAVVRADRAEKMWGVSNYEPTIVKAVAFPKVFGKYQEVTEEQVNQLIKNVEK